MAKTTKTQAKETYNEFKSILSNFNGGTSAENNRMAPLCYHLLSDVATIAKEQAENPSKRLLDDYVFWEMFQEIPAKAWRFGVKYNLIELV